MKAYLPAVAWCIFITFLSVKGGINLPESIWDFLAWDKLAHAFVYGVFAFLIMNGDLKRNIFTKKSIYIALIISILYGILMEFVQWGFFPGRYFEVLDILANIIGSFIGVYIFNKFFYNQ